jgi:uncharacterized protein YaaN involved in tellurite resistance
MASDDLVLTPPEPVKPVVREKAAGLVPLSDEQKSKLEQRAEAFVGELAALDANSPEFGKRVEQLMHLGHAEITQAASHSNRFLERPVKAMGTESSVGADLAALRRTVEDLDPKQRDLLAPKKLFGLLPYGDKVREYFDGYKTAQGHIAEILKRLASGKDELLKDNAAIDVERQALWASMQKLEQMIQVSKALDARIEHKALEVEASDAAKAKALRESALFYVRQRTTDLLTQMAVSVQGYLALDLVKKNNIELMKGVDRASTTTVAALRTAVTVAQAMTSQKLVLGQITALNTTTASIIDATSEMLRTNTATIHQQASSAAIPVETLKKAFDNIYQTMDAIDTFKGQALASMKTTVEALTGEVERSRGYIARAEGAAAALSEGVPNTLRLSD